MLMNNSIIAMVFDMNKACTEILEYQKKAENHSECWNPSWRMLNSSSQKIFRFIPGTTSCLSTRMQKAYHSGQMNELLMGQSNLKELNFSDNAQSVAEWIVL